MTNFSQTRSIDQRNRQGGFAIGLILLVVLLIAVIVGAIAIASRSSSNSGTQEKDRVAASSLLTQAQTINNGFTRATQGAGITSDRVYMSYTAGTTTALLAVRNDQANLIGQNGFFAPPSINTTAYTAGTCPADGNPLDTGIVCQFILSRIQLNNANGLSSVVYTRPLLDSVARQANAVLWNASPTVTTLPALGGTAIAAELSTLWGKNNAPAVIGDPTVITLASAALQNAAALTAWSGVNSSSLGVAGSNMPSINGTQRAEGAFAAPSASLGGNVYYRVLDNL
ncbi:MAG: hypothetical protein FJX22_02805 [Alphaproteobacteria bacterium]|nr:hypothetical protein [Alphaproteobacteria bacterium]